VAASEIRRRLRFETATRTSVCIFYSFQLTKYRNELDIFDWKFLIGLHAVTLVTTRKASLWFYLLLSLHYCHTAGRGAVRSCVNIVNDRRIINPVVFP